MSKEWYYINDIEDFVNSARKLVFKFFGQQDDVSADSVLSSVQELSEDDTNELNETLSYAESFSIVQLHAKKQIHKHTKNPRYCINDKILHKIIEALNSRMVSNILNKLTNQGVLESGYDEEINDFVFWIKEQPEPKDKKTN